jgi:hypothetical protein
VLEVGKRYRLNKKRLQGYIDIFPSWNASLLMKPDYVTIKSINHNLIMKNCIVWIKENNGYYPYDCIEPYNRKEKLERLLEE